MSKWIFLDDDLTLNLLRHIIDVGQFIHTRFDKK